MATGMPVWPAWPDFIDDAASREAYGAEPEFAAVKKIIVQEYGEEKLTQGWLKTCAELARATDEIRQSGSAIIPDIAWNEVKDGAGIPQSKIDEIRKTGCVIVRNVVPPSEADQHLQDLKEYTARNRGRYTGFPSGQPSMYDIYNSPTQNALRTHPALLELMRWMCTLWDYSPADQDASPSPLLYADGFRIRTPGSAFLGLGPHMDAGGLARWGSPSYRAVYDDVFAGRLERYSPYDMHRRKDADQAFYGGRNPSTVLRAFQGWTALSRNAPREGTIILYPRVGLATAYVLLRPFFKPPEGGEDVMDPTKWTFDPDSSWFPGTSKERGQLLSPPSHPHLRLKECMLPLPALSAGDTVWWHSDMCHAVEPEHVGDEVASVAYIAAVPTTRINREYARRQYDLMVRGQPPEDFAYGIDESELAGFEGFRGREALFQRLMGF